MSDGRKSKNSNVEFDSRQLRFPHGYQAISAQEGLVECHAPGWGVHAKQLGEFVGPKAGVDADSSIMAADVIDAGQPGEGQLREMKLAAGGFTKNEQPRVLAPFTSKRPQHVVLKLVQNEVAENDAGFGVARKRGQIVAVPGPNGRPILRSRPKIEARVNGLGRNRRGADLLRPLLINLPMQIPAQISLTRAKFQHAILGAQVGAKDAREPAVITHQPIEKSQITPVMHRVRMVGRQGVEYFRLDTPREHLGQSAVEPMNCQTTAGRGGRLSSAFGKARQWIGCGVGATPPFCHLTLVIDIRPFAKEWRVLRKPMGQLGGNEPKTPLSPLTPTKMRIPKLITSWDSS